MNIRGFRSSLWLWEMFWQANRRVAGGLVAVPDRSTGAAPGTAWPLERHEHPSSQPGRIGGSWPAVEQGLGPTSACWCCSPLLSDDNPYGSLNDPSNSGQFALLAFFAKK